MLGGEDHVFRAAAAGGGHPLRGVEAAGIEIPEEVVVDVGGDLSLVGAVGVAGVAGLEPVTSAVTGQRSNQLSYTPARTQ